MSELRKDLLAYVEKHPGIQTVREGETGVKLRALLDVMEA